jgi:hypothetical protein
MADQATADAAQAAGDKFGLLIEQLKSLFAGMGDFAPELPGDPAEREALLNDFAGYYARRAKSAYTGKTPFENYALNVDGTLRENVANKAKATAQAQYHNYKEEKDSAPKEPPIAPKANGHDTDADASEPGLDGERATPGHGAKAAADDMPPPEPQIDEPPHDGTPTSAKKVDTGEDHNAHVAAYNTEHHDASAHVRDYGNRPTEWTKIRSIFPAYADGPESEHGNGNAGRSQVRNSTHSDFNPLNYHMLRLMSVYYGGYERDYNFRAALEALAGDNQMRVEDLLALLADEKGKDQKVKAPAMVIKRDASGQPMTVDGKTVREQGLDDVELWKAVENAFTLNSLLTSNPLEQYGRNDFPVPLTGVGFASKGLYARFMRGETVHEETDSNQMAYGANMVFMDSGKSGYVDNGMRVRCYLGKDQAFGAGQAINVARIYFSARNKIQPDGKPQRIKYAVSSGVKNVFSSKHARNRDLLLLAALHEGQRNNMIPDLYVRKFGHSSPIDHLDLKKMNQSAIDEMRRLGIDPAQLVNWYNETRMNVKMGPEVSGEDATHPAGKPNSGSSGGTPSSSGSSTGDQTPNNNGNLTRGDLAAMPVQEVADRLANGPVPPEQTGQYKNLVKQVQLAARIDKFSDKPDAQSTYPALDISESDPEALVRGNEYMNALKAMHADGALSDENRVQAKQLSAHLSEDADTRLRNAGMDDIADQVQQAWNTQSRLSDLEEAISNSDILMPENGKPNSQAPIVPPKAKTPLRADPAQRWQPR